MKFCPNCGNEIKEGSQGCLNCGKLLQKEPINNSNSIFNDNNDLGSVGFAFLGFFFPIVGLILFLIWKNERPNNAKMAGMGALISTIIGLVITVITVIFVLIILGETVI